MNAKSRDSRLSLLPAVLACTLAATACQPQSGAADAAASPDQAPAAEQPAAAEPAKPADASGEIRTAFDKFLATKSYRAKMSDASGKAPASTVEFVAPDRYRIKMGTMMEQVRIGSDVYTIVGGKVTHTQADAGMPNPRDASKTMLDSLATATVESLGEDTVGGQSAKVYRVATTQPAPGENKVWISNDTGLPLKSEAKVQGAPVQMLVEYSDYDDPSISIEAPQAN